MRIPFSWLSFDQQKIHFYWFSASVIVLMLINGFVGAPLVTNAAPMGIVTFELAGTVEKSQSVMSSWDETVQKWAAFGLGFDYLFMIVYAGAIALGTLLASRSLKTIGWPLEGIGVWLAWGAFAAAGLDTLENIGLVYQLVWGAHSFWARLSQVCAIGKFSLIFLGLVYAFYALVTYLVFRFYKLSSDNSS